MMRIPILIAASAAPFILTGCSGCAKTENPNPNPDEASIPAHKIPDLSGISEPEEMNKAQDLFKDALVVRKELPADLLEAFDKQVNFKTMEKEFVAAFKEDKGQTDEEEVGEEKSAGPKTDSFQQLYEKYVKVIFGFFLTGGFHELVANESIKSQMLAFAKEGKWDDCFKWLDELDDPFGKIFSLLYQRGEFFELKNLLPTGPDYEKLPAMYDKVVEDVKLLEKLLVQSYEMTNEENKKTQEIEQKKLAGDINQSRQKVHSSLRILKFDELRLANKFTVTVDNVASPKSATWNSIVVEALKKGEWADKKHLDEFNAFMNANGALRRNFQDMVPNPLVA